MYSGRRAQQLSPTCQRRPAATAAAASQVRVLLHDVDPLQLAPCLRAQTLLSAQPVQWLRPAVESLLLLRRLSPAHELGLLLRQLLLCQHEVSLRLSHPP